MEQSSERACMLQRSAGIYRLLFKCRLVHVKKQQTLACRDQAGTGIVPRVTSKLPVAETCTALKNMRHSYTIVLIHQYPNEMCLGYTGRYISLRGHKLGYNTVNSRLYRHSIQP